MLTNDVKLAARNFSVEKYRKKFHSEISIDIKTRLNQIIIIIFDLYVQSLFIKTYVEIFNYIKHQSVKHQSGCELCNPGIAIRLPCTTLAPEPLLDREKLAKTHLLGNCFMKNAC